VLSFMVVHTVYHFWPLFRVENDIFFADLAKAIGHMQYLGDLAFKITKDDIDAIYFVRVLF
jgi:hypothetical protein